MNDEQIECAIGLWRALLGVGPSTDRPRYDQITENRGPTYVDASGKTRTYSWCGDALTYVLEVVGCADGSLLNRASLNGSWKPGDNIARVIRWAQRVGAWRTDIREGLRGAPYVLKRAGGDHIGMIATVGPQTVNTFDGNSWSTHVYGEVRANSRIADPSLYHGWVDPRLIPIGAHPVKPHPDDLATSYDEDGSGDDGSTLLLSGL